MGSVAEEKGGGGGAGRGKHWYRIRISGNRSLVGRPKTELSDKLK